MENDTSRDNSEFFAPCPVMTCKRSSTM